jgi:hypothetical protein
MAPSPISAGARSGYTDAIPANLAAVTMVDFAYNRREATWSLD